MNSYRIRFLEPDMAAVVIQADRYDLPEEDWGHVAFYRYERPVEPVASFRYNLVWSVMLVDEGRDE